MSLKKTKKLTFLGLVLLKYRREQFTMQTKCARVARSIERFSRFVRGNDYIVLVLRRLFSRGLKNNETDISRAREITLAHCITRADREVNRRGNDARRRSPPKRGSVRQRFSQHPRRVLGITLKLRIGPPQTCI